MTIGEKDQRLGDLAHLDPEGGGGLCRSPRALVKLADLALATGRCQRGLRPERIRVEISRGTPCHGSKPYRRGLARSPGESCTLSRINVIQIGRREQQVVYAFAGPGR